MGKQDFMTTYNFIEVKELADMLRVCPATVINWIKEKRIKAYTIGKEYKFLQSDILTFLEGCVA